MGCWKPYEYTAQSVVLFFFLLLHARSCETANGHELQMSYFQLQECSGESCGVPESVQNSSGVLSCARRCKTDESCIAFSVGQNGNQYGGDATGECKVHRACGSSTCDTGGVQRAWTLVAPTNGTSDASEVKILTCQNSGVWSNEEQRCTCICVDGWVDPECDRIAESCAELRTHGAYANGDHTVQLYTNTNTFTGNFLAVCALRDDAAHTYIFRNEGTDDFNKPLNMFYEYGFYHDEQNIWLGLAQTHALCTAPGHLYDSVNLRITFQGAHDKINYFNFFVGNRSTNYALSVGSSQLVRFGNSSFVLGEDYPEDLLALSNGLPFSTYDAENCPCEVNKTCASRAKAGWWHSGCDLPCNPLGAVYENLPQELAEDRIRLPGLNLHNSSYAEDFIRIELFFSYDLPKS